MMRKSLILISVLMTSFLQAQVYRSVDGAGNVIYSDEPAAGSVEVKVKELESIKSLGSPSISPRYKKQKQDEVVYTSIKIISPQNDLAIRDNTGNIRVSVLVHPGLRYGHKLVLYVDGKEYSSGRSSSFQLQNIDRGSHQLRAAVVDANGHQQISSKAVIFHLQRFSAT